MIHILTSVAYGTIAFSSLMIFFNFLEDGLYRTCKEDEAAGEITKFESEKIIEKNSRESWRTALIMGFIVFISTL